MTKEQLNVYKNLFTASDLVTVQITHAKTPFQPLQLPENVLAKMIEAQQALFEAQRLLENL